MVQYMNQGRLYRGGEEEHREVAEGRRSTVPLRGRNFHSRILLSFSVNFNIYPKMYF